MSIEAAEWNAAGAPGAFETFIAFEEGGFCPALDDISKSVSPTNKIVKMRQLESQNCSDRSKVIDPLGGRTRGQGLCTNPPNQGERE